MLSSSRDYFATKTGLKTEKAEWATDLVVGLEKRLFDTKTKMTIVPWDDRASEAAFVSTEFCSTLAPILWHEDIREYGPEDDYFGSRIMANIVRWVDASNA